MPAQTPFNEAQHKRDGGKFARTSSNAGPAMRPSNKPRPKPKPRPRTVQGLAPADIQALSAEFATLSTQLASISNRLGGTQPPRKRAALGTKKPAVKKAPAKKAAKKVDKKANAADKKKMETALAKQKVLTSFHKFLGS